MAQPSETQASLLQAIERIEAALTLVDEEVYGLSAYLIERALDQMRAVDRLRLVKRLGSISAVTADEISELLVEMFVR